MLYIDDDVNSVMVDAALILSLAALVLCLLVTYLKKTPYAWVLLSIITSAASIYTAMIYEPGEFGAILILLGMLEIGITSATIFGGIRK